MKISKVFLIGVYVHLTLFVCAIFVMKISGVLAFLWIAVYLLVCLGVMVLGWVTVGASIVASHRRRYDELHRSWRFLKLGTIPFFVANFVCCFMWSLVMVVMPPAMLLFFLLPVLFACQLIIQSGCIGVVYIHYLRGLYREKTPGAIHYFLQFIPVLDVVSTLIVLKKYEEVTVQEV